MHLFVATAQIVSLPKTILIRNTCLLGLLVALPNNKKKQSFCICNLYVNPFLYNELLELYCQHDFIIIEGYVDVKKIQVKSHNNNIKTKKQIQVKLSKIHPYIPNIVSQY
uniref:Single-stranded DNA binding protein n=1 Tax=Bornetia secundiflora TaxID=2575637 RepID=A0A4D6WRB4_9FLOR|nr:hypothetical protein [Bornetia secundiflora]